MNNTQSEKIELLVKVLKAVSDFNRLRILKILEKQERCVCEITSTLQLAPSTVSSHLSILQEAGLIKSEKHGKWIFYSLQHQYPYGCINQIIKKILELLDNDKQIEIDLNNLNKLALKIQIPYMPNKMSNQQIF